MSSSDEPEPRKVAYISSKKLLAAADQLPSNIDRASTVHGLVESYHLLASESDDDDGEEEEEGAAQTGARAVLVESKRATRDQLLAFHDSDFLDALLGGVEDDDDDSDSSSEKSGDKPSPRKRRRVEAAHDDQSGGEFGLEDDCPPFPALRAYACEVAGASIQAAREVRDGRAKIGIAWTGGRHHAKRGSSAGFCYVNDITLAILELRKPPPRLRSRGATSSTPQTRLRRILYLDIDLHHGDGVEASFFDTAEVLTLSLHLHSPGFYPATGSLTSTGPPSSPSSFHALNIALEPGLSSPTLLRLYESCVAPTYSAFKPDAVVLQCGADGLAGDPCKEWNLDLDGMGRVVKKVLEWDKPTLLLGGGGYDTPNAARCWTYLTAIALGRELTLDSHIPPSIDDYAIYGPSFTLDVPAGNMLDKNTPSTLKAVEEAFKGHISEVVKRSEGVTN